MKIIIIFILLTCSFSIIAAEKHQSSGDKCIKKIQSVLTQLQDLLMVSLVRVPEMLLQNYS